MRLGVAYRPKKVVWRLITRSWNPTFSGIVVGPPPSSSAIGGVSRNQLSFAPLRTLTLRAYAWDMRVSLLSSILFWVVQPSCAYAGQELPAIGTSVHGQDRNVGGWSIESRGSWCSVGFDPACSMLRLQVGETAAVVITKPTQRSPTGGIQAEVIIRAFKVRIPPGVTLAECRSIDGRPAVVGWLDRRHGVATVFTTDGKTLFRTKLPFQGEEPCEIGEN